MHVGSNTVELCHKRGVAHRTTMLLWLLLLCAAHPSQCNPHSYTHYHHGYKVSPVCPGQYDDSALDLMIHERTNSKNYSSRLYHEFVYRPFYLAELHEEAVLSSDKPPPPHDISLVTVFSLGRLTALMHQCISWPGSIVASLYVPLQHTEGQPHMSALVEPSYAAALPSIFPKSAQATTLQHVYDLLIHQRAIIEQQGACSLNILLYTEVLPARYEVKPMRLLYGFPVNALRNRAILHTKTEFMLYADGDFIPGPTGMLYDMLHHGQGFGTMPLPVLQQHLRNGSVVVAPAFQHEKGKANVQHVRELVDMPSKQGLQPLLASNTLQDFQTKCHAATNSSRWIMDDEAYAVHVTCAAFCYEPYVFARVQDVPLLDERYRGYFENKIAWISDMTLRNIKFIVHPQVFVIHAPHEHTIKGYVHSLETFPQKLKHMKYRLRTEKCNAVEFFSQQWEAPTVLLSRDDPYCTQRMEQYASRATEEHTGVLQVAL